MGNACCRSGALPCGTPSTTSISTTSASSLAMIQCAAVDPTLPAPTMLTFLRISFSPRGMVDAAGSEQLTANSSHTEVGSSGLNCLLSAVNCQLLHIPYDACGKFAGPDLGGARSLALKVIGYKLLQDGLFKRLFDELGGFFPANEFKQHDA